MFICFLSLIKQNPTHNIDDFFQGIYYLLYMCMKPVYYILLSLKYIFLVFYFLLKTFTFIPNYKLKLFYLQHTYLKHWVKQHFMNSTISKIDNYI